MKKIFLSVLAMVCAMSLTSCDDFLDSENYTESNSGNYPGSVNDLNKLLSALYGVMNQYGADPLQTPWFVWHLMSDDANGAGGTGDVECTAVSQLITNKDDLYDITWHCTYVGIARANSIISSVDACDWSGNESSRNQMLGEAYFMRGLFYLWGSQLFGDIPAYWDAAAPDPCPQQSAEEVIYPHILADFYSAMNLMSHNTATRAEGHATKVTAEGFLARAYMFYEGFYKKAGELATASPAGISLPSQEGCEGVTLTKSMVISALDDAKSSGAYLIEDYRLLWQYTNSYTAPDYPFVEDLAKGGNWWAGNGNAEQIFDVKYANVASWNDTYTMGYTNMTSLYCSLRCDEENGQANGGPETFPFAQGWGQGVFNSALWDAWDNSDPRKKATILDGNEGGELSEITCPVIKPAEEDEDGEEDATESATETEVEYYQENSRIFYTTSCSEETGYYNKKWMAFTAAETTWDNNLFAYTWWGVSANEGGDYVNNNGNSFQGDHFCDIVLMRYADILLMHSELSGDADGMNQVRARAGLSSTSYSLTNIQNERRWEFAGEGIRFNDLRRWSGKNGGSSCMAATALEAQNGTKIYYTGPTTTSLRHTTSSWAQRYADTDGFLPIPPAQITATADESVLKQNAGWGSGNSNANMSGKLAY